jgi:hypothetical protein
LGCFYRGRTGRTFPDFFNVGNGVGKTVTKVFLQPTPATLCSFPFILTLTSILLLAYVFVVPAFEGADEPDHVRYIEAVSKAEKIHPVDLSDPRKYGIEVYQPPLYYYLAASAAFFFPAAYPDSLAVNPDKNPNFPFLAHDAPGELFPYDSSGRTLRIFRLISALMGIASLMIFHKTLRILIPSNPQVVNTTLLVAAIWPNNLHMFSIVSNDALAYLLSLALVLTALQCLQADKPHWKQGLLGGTLFALALLTKMTALLTGLVIVAVFVWDAMGSRKRALCYLGLLPFILIPIAVLAGPFLFLGFQWYGSPSRISLLETLTPAWVRHTPRSFGMNLMAMWDILPGTFVAALRWQQQTYPTISFPLFLIWLLFGVVLAVRTSILIFGETSREETLSRLLVLASFGLMFLALYRIASTWVGVQFRHAWNLWPMTLVAPYFALKDMKCLRGINGKGMGTIVFVGLLLFLLPTNLFVLYDCVRAYRISPGPWRSDSDYFTLIDYWVQNPEVGLAYLDCGELTDVKAYRYFAKKKRWEIVLHHARRALEQGINDPESRHVAASALRSLGRPEEAMSLLHQGNDGSFDTRFLEADLLVDLKRFSEATEKILQLMREAPGEKQEHLHSLLDKVTAKSPPSGIGGS